MNKMFSVDVKEMLENNDNHNQNWNKWIYITESYRFGDERL